MEGIVDRETSNALSGSTWFVPNCSVPTVLMRLLVGFVACTLLLTHPPPSLSLLLEEYDLPSLGSAEVEWRQMFSGETFS